MRSAFRPGSIAFHLIVAVLSVELLSSLLVIFLSFGYERHIHFRAFDVMLHGHADSVLGAVQDAEDAADNVMLDQADLRLPPDDIYEVYDSNGRLLGRSLNWEGAPLDLAVSSRDGFAKLVVHDHHYRILRMHGSRIVDPGKVGGGKLRNVIILYGSPTERVWRAIRGAVEFYAAGSVLLLLVTGPLIAWLLHRGLLPLRQLATLASLVSVDAWSFDPPASARDTFELAPLTLTIENLLQRLERSFVQQRCFVSDAAHELKTAVAVVKSSLQLLAMKRRTAEEYRVGLDRCMDDCLRLEEIVAKMLTLARIENYALSPASHPVADIAECLRQTVAQLESFARLRGLRAIIATPPLAACSVPIPAEDCSLLLSNLLLNALQHSRPESTVELRLTADGTTIDLQIEDHGEGIDLAALPHVFERFYRGDPSRTHSTGGTGLGLSIAKVIVERGGGTIVLASRPGQGTIVTVRLPLAERFSANQPEAR